MPLLRTISMALLCFALLATPAAAGAPKTSKSTTICPLDTVQVGPLCVDKFEESV